MTMKNKPGRMVAALILSLMLVGWSGLPALADKEVPRMSIDELKGILDSKDLILLDVRAGKDWSSSELKIVGTPSRNIAETTVPKQALGCFERIEGNRFFSVRWILYCGAVYAARATPYFNSIAQTPGGTRALLSRSPHSQSFPIPDPIPFQNEILTGGVSFR
jgi:hypothetical protein